MHEPVARRRRRRRRHPCRRHPLLVLLMVLLALVSEACQAAAVDRLLVLPLPLPASVVVEP